MVLEGQASTALTGTAVCGRYVRSTPTCSILAGVVASAPAAQASESATGLSSKRRRQSDHPQTRHGTGKSQKAAGRTFKGGSISVGWQRAPIPRSMPFAWLWPHPGGGGSSAAFMPLNDGTETLLKKRRPYLTEEQVRFTQEVLFRQPKRGFTRAGRQSDQQIQIASPLPGSGGRLRNSCRGFHKASIHPSDARSRPGKNSERSPLQPKCTR
jgi:hypothetical protein